MPRFMINDQHQKHASEAKILELLERMLPGDVITIKKNIATGWYVEMAEGSPPKPRIEDEG